MWDDGYGNQTAGENSIAKSNLFARLSADWQNKGLKWELAVWIGTCTAVVLAFLTFVLALSRSMGGMSGFCFFLIILGAGYGTFLIFRWKKISILYGNVLFPFIMMIAYYIMERRFFWYAPEGLKIALVLLFTLELLCQMAVIICGILDCFTAFNLELPIAICCWVAMGLTILLLILPYLFGSDVIGDYIDYRIYSLIYFGIGSLAFYVMCGMVWIYTLVYCMGTIDHREGVPFQGSASPKTERSTGAKQMPIGIQCIKGSYQGKAFPVKGEIIIGSQPGSAHLVIQDAYISKQHCTIRYNTVSECYEVRDLSTNGVYLKNGMRMQQGVYTSCPRGTVILVGSANQQFRLL